METGKVPMDMDYGDWRLGEVPIETREVYALNLSLITPCICNLICEVTNS